MRSRDEDVVAVDACQSAAFKVEPGGIYLKMGGGVSVYWNRRNWKESSSLDPPGLSWPNGHLYSPRFVHRIDPAIL